MIVVDNLSQLDPSGGGIAGSGVFGPSAAATQFTVGPGSWAIDSITVRLEELTGNNPDQVVFRILSDNAGTPGATVFGTLAATSNITTTGSYSFSPQALN